MATVKGGVDGRGRPVVWLQLVTPVQIEILAMVDTGFNGDLYIHHADAFLIGLRLSGIETTASVAGGEVRRTELSSAKVDWLDRETRVELLLDIAGSKSRDGDPIALIETRMLAPNLLLIDFEAGTVEIERQ